MEDGLQKGRNGLEYGACVRAKERCQTGNADGIAALY